MKAQEVIKILKTLYPKTCKMVNGRYVGGFDDHDCIKGQAIDKAIELLEKQIAKKPNLWGDGYSDGELVYDMYRCPNCEVNYEIDDWNDYCPNCGQKLDWSEVDE